MIEGDSLSESRAEAASALHPENPMPVVPPAAPPEHAFVSSGSGLSAVYENACSGKAFGCHGTSEGCCNFRGYNHCRFVISLQEKGQFNFSED